MLDHIREMNGVLARMKGRAPRDAYRALACLRDDVAIFDARHYFRQPVRLDRHELFRVAEAFMDMLHVPALRDEMTAQLREVGELAAQKLESIHTRKLDRINVTLALFATFLALMDILSHTPKEWMRILGKWFALIFHGSV